MIYLVLVLLLLLALIMVPMQSTARLVLAGVTLVLIVLFALGADWHRLLHP